MNVVSIMAHQDDEMRCLGTLLKCRARGDRLHFVTITARPTGWCATAACWQPCRCCPPPPRRWPRLRRSSAWSRTGRFHSCRVSSWTSRPSRQGRSGCSAAMHRRRRPCARPWGQVRQIVRPARRLLGGKGGLRIRRCVRAHGRPRRCQAVRRAAVRDRKSMMLNHEWTRIDTKTRRH